MKLIVDLVPNHTSDRHPWFQAARASRENPWRDWYLWHDPAEDGGPPNNWLSQFGGSAWEWDEPTGQYYYHAFLNSQPDLNWRNPAVRAALYDVMRFWLARGVDGFRVDVLWHLIKDDRYRDNPPNPNFQLLAANWNARSLASLIDQYEALLPRGGWPNWVLGNHDNPRITSRVGPQQARIAAMLLLTLRGTPTMYYGDELGMVNVPITADRVQDLPGAGVGRDGCRTPMQWDGTEGAGFTNGSPWLPLSDVINPLQGITHCVQETVSVPRRAVRC